MSLALLLRTKSKSQNSVLMGDPKLFSVFSRQFKAALLVPWGGRDHSQISRFCPLVSNILSQDSSNRYTFTIPVELALLFDMDFIQLRQ